MSTYVEVTNAPDQFGYRIVGEIFTLDELCELERKLGASDAEVAYFRTSTLQNMKRGKRYGDWYSTRVPDGEWGSWNKAYLTPKTKEEFDSYLAELKENR